MTEGKVQVSSLQKATGPSTAIRELPSGLGYACPVPKSECCFDLTVSQNDIEKVPVKVCVCVCACVRACVRSHLSHVCE